MGKDITPLPYLGKFNVAPIFKTSIVNTDWAGARYSIRNLDAIQKNFTRLVVLSMTATQYYLFLQKLYTVYMYCISLVSRRQAIGLM